MISELLRPWRTGRTWGALAHAALDVVLGPLYFVLIVVPLALSLWGLIVFPVAIVSAWGLFVIARVLGTIERNRVAALLGLELPDPHAPLPDAHWFRRLWARIASPSRWREVGYLLLHLPLGLLSFTVVIGTWSVALATALLPFTTPFLARDRAEIGLFEVAAGWQAVLAGVVGVLAVAVVAPWVTTAVATLETGAARLLLGPPEDEVVAARVAHVEAGRVAAVGAAEAERRRIERDLHDGAQQRLVALAMDLGMANERFETNIDEARRLVADAHLEAKAALAELRDLVRGLHPSILEDRGLDAALSALVARVPVPVQIDVRVHPRPSPEVESAAYFVITEALTNVVKHSGATRARVTVARRGDRLALDVTDDGRGGADPARGTGLAGLQDRVRSLDGWMQVMSPDGGPTSILVELPCAS